MASEDHSTIFKTVTNTFLLNGLKDPSNGTVWQSFVDRYRPMIERFAARRVFPKPTPRTSLNRL